MRGMYICLCNAVTDHDIRREVADGVRTFAQLQARTGCSDCCGCCEPEARACLTQAIEQHESVVALPAFVAAA